MHPIKRGTGNCHGLSVANFKNDSFNNNNKFNDAIITINFSNKVVTY